MRDWLIIKLGKKSYLFDADGYSYFMHYWWFFGEHITCTSAPAK